MLSKAAKPFVFDHVSLRALNYFRLYEYEMPCRESRSQYRESRYLDYRIDGLHTYSPQAFVSLLSVKSARMFL